MAIDMDGTLLASNSRVSPRNLAALRAAERAGAEIVIATGRRHCYAMKVLRELNLNPASALVSSNGTVVRTIAAELLHRTLLPLSTARWLCTHLADFRNSLVVTFDAVDANGEDTRGALVVEHLDTLHASIGGWMRANEPYIEQVQALEAALEAGPPIQMMLCGPIDLMRQAEALLLQHEGVAAAGITPLERIHTAEVALHRTEYAERDLCIVDLLPAGCSKGSAILRQAADRGVRPADILAIGDNWNDVSMLEIAGHAVVMSNAPADLKLLAAQRGWAVGLSNEEDGVAAAIETALAKIAASAL
ncbi:MAG TPA: HAD family hydrolase [Acidobacteriaceae bacterium]|nr:HAD family hydrolase [Acidobacteriaceae bacterium]